MHHIRTKCTAGKYPYKVLNIQFTDLEKLPNSKSVLINMP